MIRSFLLLGLSFLAADPARAGEKGIDFQRDIRPILSDKCFQCHGPDEKNREAELRLDLAKAAHESVIVPGKPAESEFMARITTNDKDTRMPPADSGKSLTRAEVELLERWVASGAKYETHWAFLPPVRPEVPKPANGRWVQNAIDAFVLRRLEQEELTPSPETDRVTWLRRLSLDLTGLPPTIEEVDAFVADMSKDAYSKQIKRLLKSPHFGERWGRIWLDAARYADSDGYEKDKPREMWFYRDWVVNALNRDLPYDQFIIHQIAGDLLPVGWDHRPVEKATRDNGPKLRLRQARGNGPKRPSRQENLVATGFLRNSMVNEEGGADPEQFRMEAMFDRMDAIGKSVLGLTIHCGQCHSHKYDPLTQEDYYGLFAFLNNTHDAIIPAYTGREQQERLSIFKQIAAIESELKQAMPDWQSRMAEWEKEARRSVHNWEVLKPVDRPYEGQKFRLLEDDSIISESYAPTNSSPQFGMNTKAQGITGVRLELLTHPQLPRRGPGRSIRGTGALTEFAVFIAPTSDPAKRTKVKIVSATADVNPPKTPQPDYLKNKKTKGGDKRVTGPIEFAIDGDRNTAWTTDSDPGRRNQPRKAVFRFEKPVGFAEGSIITIQPTMSHGGWNSDDNHNCLMGRYRFSLTSDAEPVADPLPRQVREILELEKHRRTLAQQAAVFSYWRTTVDKWAEANAKIESLWKQHPEGSTQLVLEERTKPRTTSILERGDFLKPQGAVTPDVPEFLHSLPDHADGSRLTFAKWLVDRRSPTTARSIVNRIWQGYFGIGLVETSEDLGSQGTPPSHPELLDWLAVELMENNWSLKHIHRLIVSSATYRQSSKVKPELYQRDPYNRLLARGPRFRVDAEIVRDITLAASGLLNPKLGGPSVYPPAPRFLFEPPASYGPKTWNEAAGEDRYRRRLYTFRFRSVPYPMLETFDSVPGNVSCVRRNLSNTPLQALTVLNEPLSMECARALASRTLREGGDSDKSRLTYAVRRCIARTPDAGEIATLTRLLEKQRQRLQKGEIEAAKILGSTGNKKEDNNELAAWTLVARVLLSLDETMTKE